MTTAICKSQRAQSGRIRQPFRQPATGPATIWFDAKTHPCFNRDSSRRFGRVHLPVAPRCNIRCNYCSRLFDCPNEGRPGVTSRLLEPAHAAGSYLDSVLARTGPVSVVGIAGPGDPLANPDRTFRTLAIVRRRFPGMLTCLSTNGLAAAAFLPEIVRLVSHVTITVNAVDDMIGSQIYQWIKIGTRISTGVDAARFLRDRQMEAVRLLKRAGVMVKVNAVVIPGINDRHVVDIAREMDRLSVDIFNAMPLRPVAGTPFAQIGQPGAAAMRSIREHAGEFLPQMTHCARCRADAAGLIGADAPALETCAVKHGIDWAGSLEEAKPGPPAREAPHSANLATPHHGC